MTVDRRLFLAAALDDDTRHALAAFLSHPATPEVPGRRVPPENWHISLRFLGRSSVLRQEKVLAELDRLIEGGAFDVGFAGLGAFPRPAKATVAWLRVEHGAERLRELAVGCERAAVNAGFDPEERPFHPHLTLSRLRPQRSISQTVADFPRFPGRLRVDVVTMYESLLGGGLARYEVIDTVELHR